MKRAILLLVVVVGGAFYLGWFTFTTDSSGPQEHINIVIDKDKVRQDEGRAVEKLHAFEQQVETQNQAAPGTSPQVDRSADRRMRSTPEPVPYQPQPTAGVVEPAPTGGDPYQLPEESPPAARPAARTAGESFSRGFQ